MFWCPPFSSPIIPGCANTSYCLWYEPKGVCEKGLKGRFDAPTQFKPWYVNEFGDGFDCFELKILYKWLKISVMNENIVSSFFLPLVNVWRKKKAASLAEAAILKP